ncbi:polysaccharide deacetylase family protein [Tardiphaga sp. P9-11]|uniref:polysaccharide deacetylase family protein n=1 Tax=Tardiphaga sp. P9-11 TaxID=2024614 RepID=UPI0011F1C454|nr:polysaccharide deacetylase family protein [Tardiphaga sp. P9-11]KAA0076078.1 polysaccharide deacetylase [Tardiphaga sp. P9-11]
MSYRTGWRAALAFELTYLSGTHRLLEGTYGGAGIILKFERVRPPRQDAFQPLKSHEITPGFLDRAIRALKRWPVDIVGIDEACRRASAPREGLRFVALTFDGGTRDFIDFAYPLLAAHEVPFTLYLPSAFADGLGAMWWLALEQAIATHDRISLMIDHRQRHFETASSVDKYRAYYYLDSWMRILPPHELAVATDDLCKRYSVDLASLSRHAALSWDDVATFVSNPRATVGSSTVNYPALANLGDNAALREIAMGRAVTQAALPYAPRHFAFPFGDERSFDQRHIAMAGEAGFASAVTSIPGVIRPDSGSDIHALPRLAWDGRRTSLRALRVMVSGLMLGAGARR